MSISTAYTNWSNTYDTDRNLTRDLDQTVTREMLAEHHPATILELGCGTGKNTDFLAQIGGHVYALDFSEGMLTQARAKILPVHPNVTFTLADLTQRWPCPDESIDLVVCNLVLEHIPDLDFIFGEAHRVLAKGGEFFVCELHPFKQYQGRKATFQHGGQQVEITAFVHHLSDFLGASEKAGFAMKRFKEWWHAEDHEHAPRLVSLLLGK